MNIDAMKASWLEAVAHGEAEGFSRHFVPDILEALVQSERQRKEAEAKRDEAREAGYAQGVENAESRAARRIKELEAEAAAMREALSSLAISSDYNPGSPMDKCVKALAFNAGSAITARIELLERVAEAATDVLRAWDRNISGEEAHRLHEPLRVALAALGAGGEKV